MEENTGRPIRPEWYLHTVVSSFKEIQSKAWKSWIIFEMASPICGITVENLVSIWRHLGINDDKLGLSFRSIDPTQHTFIKEYIVH